MTRTSGGGARASRRTSPPAGATAISARGAAFALAAAVLLCWPMLILGAPIFFYDSPTYVAGGEVAWEGTLGLLESFSGAGAGEAATTVTGGGALAEARAAAWAVRSVPYSLYAYIASSTLLGLVLPVILQTAAVLMLLFSLLDREIEARPLNVAAFAAACAALTSLPWFASYLMPDLLAAGVILYAMLVARGIDALDAIQRLVLVTLAAFAIASHYGHIPLAAACLLAALGLRLITRRLTLSIAVLGLAPLLLAVAANLAIGLVAFGEASLTPRHLPLPLARSIADGPARWYLEKHCETERYAVCEYFKGEIPEDIGGVMWREGSLRDAPDDQLERVREEEMEILWGAFLEHTAAQSWALARNALTQLTRFGLESFRPGRIVSGDEGQPKVEFAPKPPLIDAWGRVLQALVVVAALVLAVAILRGRLTPRERDFVIVLAVGLLANAAVFGGLSAPDPRYQARIMWLVPVLVGMVWLRRGASRAESKAPPIEAA